MTTLHTKVSIEVDEVRLMVAVWENVVEEDVRRDAVPTVGGASREETKMKPLTSGEYSVAVAMGLGPGVRGIPNFTRCVVGMSVIFIR